MYVQVSFVAAGHRELRARTKWTRDFRHVSINRGSYLSKTIYPIQAFVLKSGMLELILGSKSVSQKDKKAGA